jgi:predicted ester cyclase
MRILVLLGGLALLGGGQPAELAESDLPLAPITTPKVVTRAGSLTEAQAAQLLRTARLFYTFWNTGDVRYARAAVSPDFKDNTLPPGRPQGLPGLQAASKGFLAAVPDLKCTLEDVVLANDKVVARLLFTGHNTGPFGAHPASGKAIRFIAIDILHIRDGKIYEDWHLEDNLTFQQQIGVVKP